jgi:hypothetical protein
VRGDLRSGPDGGGSSGDCRTTRSPAEAGNWATFVREITAPVGRGRGRQNRTRRRLRRLRGAILAMRACACPPGIQNAARCADCCAPRLAADSRPWDRGAAMAVPTQAPKSPAADWAAPSGAGILRRSIRFEYGVHSGPYSGQALCSASPPSTCRGAGGATTLPSTSSTRSTSGRAWVTRASPPSIRRSPSCPSA